MNLLATHSSKLYIMKVMSQAEEEEKKGQAGENGVQKYFKENLEINEPEQGSPERDSRKSDSFHGAFPQ